MKILVTGAAGFLGRRIIDRLFEQGHEVLALDLHMGNDRRIEWAWVDLVDLDAVEKAVVGTDAIIHVAAIVNAGPDNLWARQWACNVTGTYNIFEAAARQKIPKVIYATSYAVFTAHWHQASDFVKYLPHDNDTPIHTGIADPYTLSKVINEQTAAIFFRSKRLETAIGLRFAHIVDVSGKGPTQWAGTIETLQVDVDDAAQACCTAAVCDFKGHDTFLICQKHRYDKEGNVLTPEQILEQIKNDSFEHIELRHNFPYEWNSPGYCQPAIDILGYDPKY